MKKTILLIFIYIIALTAFGKALPTDQIPGIVKNNFYKNYPNAEVVKWKIIQENNYRVEFWEEDYYMIVFYDAQGNFMESNLIIDWLSLPAEGRKEIQPLGKHIQNIFMITHPDHEVLYQVNYLKNLGKHQLLLDSKGNIIQ